MAKTVRSRPGEPLDLICWRHYGGTAGGIVERVLAANTFLRHHAVALPGGLLIVLPDLPAAATPAPVIKLWD